MLKTYTPNLKKKVGKGSFGKIYKSNEDENVVVKVLDKKFYDKACNIYNEKLIKITQGHINLAIIHTYYIIDMQFNIILEYLDGKDLFDVILDKNGLAEPIYNDNKTLSSKSNPIVKHITNKVLIALNYLHHNGIVHGDVKPDNIRILSDGSIKLFDYTLVRKVGESLSNVGGTFGYVAPEILFYLYKNDRRYGEIIDGKADIWSLGISIYLMMECLMLFPASAPKYSKYIFEWADKGKTSLTFNFDKWDDDLIDLFDSIVILNPKSRKSAEYLLENFFNKNTIDPPNISQ